MRYLRAGWFLKLLTVPLQLVGFQFPLECYTKDILLKMMTDIFQGTFVLLCIGHMAFASDALFYLEEVKTCSENAGADQYIAGDTKRSVSKFLSEISGKKIFALTGDTTVQSDGCRKGQDEKMHALAEITHGSTVVKLFCWDPLECTLADDSNEQFLKLYPVGHDLPRRRTSVRTVLLPLDAHNTATYTFLPYNTEKNMFFVTAALTGCSVFVLKPNQQICNMIVIHTNYQCDDPPSSEDHNHIQAMAVLTHVQGTNRGCTYRINRRWASSRWQENIAAKHYDYHVAFYNSIDVNLLYGSKKSGEKWSFCIKPSLPQRAEPSCASIE